VYLGNTDIELLQLAAWCKNLPSDMTKSIASRTFDSTRIKLLDQAGLLNVTENEKSVRLREGGWRLLDYLGSGYHKDSSYRSAYERRVESSWILLTFWRAGYNVFGSALVDLAPIRAYASSMAARRNAARGGDIWGGAVFWGLGRHGNTVSSCYYFTGNEKMLLGYRSEKILLDKAAAVLGTKSAMIFAGKGSKGSGYGRMAKVLRKTKAVKAPAAGEKFTLTDIYHNAMTPIHLLECSDEGALQLLIMAQDDYRKRLCNIVFRGYDTPPVGITSADGALHVSQTEIVPCLLAVDMDISRIGRVIRQTTSAGYTLIVIACLPKQEAALKILFGDDIAKYVIVQEKNIIEAFGVIRLYEPAPGPYLDCKGGIIDAANLPVRRKMGKQAHRKAEGSQE